MGVMLPGDWGKRGLGRPPDRVVNRKARPAEDHHLSLAPNAWPATPRVIKTGIVHNGTPSPIRRGITMGIEACISTHHMGLNFR